MSRRLILAALALFAFLSLESCGMARSVAPKPGPQPYNPTIVNPTPVPSMDPGQNEQPVEGHH